MTAAKLPPHELPAYYHAAQAVLAVELGIKVNRVSIEPNSKGRTYTRLATLEESCNLKNPYTVRTNDRIEKYVTTLLGGFVGRQLRVEMNHGYASRCTGQVILQRRYFAALRNCDEADIDRAFAIALAWLKLKDNGQTMVTLERLWQRAQRLLRTDRHHRSLTAVAENLKEVGTISGREIVNLID